MNELEDSLALLKEKEDAEEENNPFAKQMSSLRVNEQSYSIIEQVHHLPIKGQSSRSTSQSTCLSSNQSFHLFLFTKYFKMFLLPLRAVHILIVTVIIDSEGFSAKSP